MTGFLASVTSIEEAALVVEHADIIDLKNPAAGALGALPHDVVEAIVRFIDGRKPVSATVGDLPMSPDILPDAVSRMRDQGVDIVKVGLFGGESQKVCIDRLGRVAEGSKVVAVLFADRATDFGLLELLAANRFYGAMLDTAEKAGGALRRHMVDGLLQDFVHVCRENHLCSGLAGSLSVEDVAPLKLLGADYLGFRGALCFDRDRKASIEHDAVIKIASMLRKCNTVAGVRKLELQS